MGRYKRRPSSKRRKSRSALKNALILLLLVEIGAVLWYTSGFSLESLKNTLQNPESYENIPMAGGIKAVSEQVGSLVHELTKENSTIEDSKKAIEKINEMREKYGRKPIKFDERAYRLALARAKDMVENEYFDHVNPKTKECAVSIRFKYGFKPNEYVAENIFGEFEGYSFEEFSYYYTGIEEKAIQSWMDSRGHRYNLLYPNHYAGAVACYRGACVFIGVNHDRFSDRCTTGLEGQLFWESAPKQPYEI